MQNCKIQISGISPNGCKLVEIDSMLRFLQMAAPSDSYLKLIIVGSEGSVHGALSITSSSTQFKYENRGSDLMKVCHRIKKEMASLIKDWARCREF